MSWASHPTSEMPTQPSPPTGRHRAQRGRVIGIAAAGVAALVLVAVVFFSGLLGSSPDSGTALAGPTSTDGSAAPAGVGPGGSGGGGAGEAGPGSGTTPGAPAAGPAASAEAQTLEGEVLALSNGERAKVGCAALRLDAGLAAAARAHSLDMATTGVFGHPGSDGSDPGARMQRAGYDTGAGWAENIARGQPNAAAVLAAWMGSPDHRSNILNCDFVALGVGSARGGSGQLYWTQDFGGK
jgi:uncharacterized protein YkwD